MSESRGEMRALGDARPRPDVWICPHCGSRIQVIIDPNHTWDQPFTCVCGTRMEPGEMHAATFVTDSECTHCGVKIVDYRTSVEVDGQRYCCPNCAAAEASKPETAAHRHARGP